MLDTQYRMHPTISRFPSSEFYNYTLLDGTVNEAGNVLPGLSPPVCSHLPVDPKTGERPSLVFVHHEGPESLKDRSRVNWMEAYIVCSIVEELLLNNPVSALDISFPSISYLTVHRTFVARILESLHLTSHRSNC
jgi:superfamily I DNA and/or RNA helicase